MEKSRESSYSTPLEGQPPQPTQGPGWEALTRKYLRDLPRQLNSITAILESKDYERIKTEAHRIKGTSGTYRLEAIARGAARIEKSAEMQHPQQIAAAIEEVNRLIDTEARKLQATHHNSEGSADA